MSKARDLASAAPAPSTVSATELGYVNGVTSAIQTQIDAKEATLPSQTGNSGKYLTTDGSAKSWGTVNTGYTWTQRLGGISSTLYTVAYNGTNLYVAAGDNGLLYSSPDGVTWTSRTSGFSTTVIRKVAYGNGLWVAVGDSGKITTSTDGTTWTARTSNVAGNTLYDVVYDNSIWVAVGQGGGATNTGGLTYSTDGLTWTRKSQTPAVGSTYYSVIWNGTNWIIGTTLGDYNYIYATAPSGTWTGVMEHSSASAVIKIVWDGTRHYYYGSDTGWNYSTSTSTLASSAAVNGAGIVTTSQAPANKIFYYNNNIYQGNIYWNSFSPTSTGIVAPTQVQFSPTATLSASGVLTGEMQAVFVGSAGLIVLGSQKIYTSF